ncbi:MAG TPA: sigma factor-like helix-turn-helix DNA-binding protein [Acidimicrobiia bacterium]|nr:sigma factor-like helix-turn-helix DNA-binding protein [Acidimicrobiia bacterium]
MDPSGRVVTQERSSASDSFEAFFSEAEPRLRRALVAAYGLDRGREAAAEALAWAWEHWAELASKTNPVGYIYRIGVRRTRWRRMPVTYEVADRHETWFEPKLRVGLEELTKRQRTAVVLVHAFGWQLHEVADVTGIAVTTVQSHLDRGMAKLRAALEVDADE